MPYHALRRNLARRGEIALRRKSRTKTETKANATVPLVLPRNLWLQGSNRGLTCRSTGRATAYVPGRAALWFMMHRAARAARRSTPVNFNVRHHIQLSRAPLASNKRTESRRRLYDLRGRLLFWSKPRNRWSSVTLGLYCPGERHSDRRRRRKNRVLTVVCIVSLGCRIQAWQGPWHRSSRTHGSRGTS